MRTSTTIFASLSLLAGLVSAQDVEIQPDFQGVMTGGICCSPTPCEDASGQCDKAKLTPFCVSSLFLFLVFLFFFFCSSGKANVLDARI